MTPSEFQLTEALRYLVVAASTYRVHATFATQEALDVAIKRGYQVLDIAFAADPQTPTSETKKFGWPPFDTPPFCHSCGVLIGEYHVAGCGGECCPDCGHQLIRCPCNPENIVHPRIPYTKTSMIYTACWELGFYARPKSEGYGWIPCKPGTPGSLPDINRLYEETDWDPKQKKFVLRSLQETTP